MPENEFEHRVQQKMEEFQLRPSDLVWTEVERRIRKEKRRRFIFWWFLLAGLLGGGIVTTLLLTGKKEKSTGITNINDKSNSLKNSNTGSENNSTQGPGNNDINNPAGTNTITIPDTSAHNIMNTRKEREQPVQLISQAEKNNPAPGNKPSVRKKGNQFNGEAILSVTQQDAAGKKKKPAQENYNTGIIQEPSLKYDTAVTVINSNTVGPVVVTTAVAAPAAPSINPDTVNNIAGQLQKQVVRDTSIVDSTITATLPSLRKNISKWKWDVSVSGGRSSIVYGFGKFKQANQVDAAQGIGGGGGTGGTPVAYSVNISPVRSGFSWAARVFAGKEIANNFGLVLGLGYDYYSTRMEVGQRVDSSRNVNNAFSGDINVGAFYRTPGSTGSSGYTNQYHFMGLSAELSWKIVRGSKFSLYWKNGLQYNQLLSSTMLHYNSGIGGFYRDNSILKKGHLFYTTGLSVPLGQRWQFNPYFNYGLTTVLNNGESRTHYNSAGLRVIFSLQKNK